MTGSIAQRFTRQYSIALALVAGLTMAGQWLIQRQIQDQLNDSWLVNHAGRQRFQSQQIAKDALLLVSQPAERAFYVEDLRQVLGSWEHYHQELKTGRLAELHATVENSETLEKLFVGLEPPFRSVSRSAHALIRWSDQGGYPGAPEARAALQSIITNEKVFLRQMDRIVAQYEAEARSKVERLRAIEQLLMALTLIVLVLEALFIFRPAVRAIEKTMSRLIASERRAVQISLELQDTSTSLRSTRAQLVEQQLNEQKIRLASVMQGQDEERRRISRELHDGIGQMLTGLKLGAEQLQPTAFRTPTALRQFTDLKDLILRTIQEVRNVSNELMPTALNDFGLESALRQLVDLQQKQTTTLITFHSGLKNRRLDKAMEMGLYRIAQEAIHNAVKHADADHIDLEVYEKHGRIRLRVEDDGIGFVSRTDSALDLRSTGTPSQGLRNMQERTRLMKGTWQIESEPGEGTVIEVSVPALSLSAKQYATHV
ncbi:ATP-binding protein [Larkinella soli]|uniref:ATP-binding protein n=1 Tax=Larkinella soli TaxID=1770527 RepID=UPI000FFC41CA|nr:ATP-binding protein [Larkinella soli]